MDISPKGGILYDPSAFSRSLKFEVSLVRGKTPGDRSDIRVLVQCKNLVTKDVYSASISTEELRRDMEFHQSLQGYYNRLRTALNYKDPDDLRCFFWYFTDSPENKKRQGVQGDSMGLLLQQTTKFDGDLNWLACLRQLEIEATDKLGERLTDVASEVKGSHMKIRTKLTSVVEQVRHKFDEAEEERSELDQRMDKMEQVLQKVVNKVKQLNLEVSRKDEQIKEANDKFEKVVGQLTELVTERDVTAEARMKGVIELLEKHKRLTDARCAEFDKKLIRWRDSSEFPQRQDYINYVISMLDKWDKRFGRVYVTVVVAKGKSARYLGHIGEPVKWTANLCWVRWLTGGQRPTEGYSWSTLELFLPESAYYYPRPNLIRQPGNSAPATPTMNDQLMIAAEDSTQTF